MAKKKLPGISIEEFHAKNNPDYGGRDVRQESYEQAVKDDPGTVAKYEKRVMQLIERGREKLRRR